MIKTLILLFLFLLFTSCSNKKTLERPDVEQPKYSFQNLLSNYGKDTLFIKSRFADCGEWGGHEELMKIYRSDRKLKLTYIKFKVDCGVRDSLGSIVQTEKFTHHILLSNSQQIALMKYMNDLMKFKFLDEEISHSGNSFSISNTKEDLKISRYGNKPILIDSYNSLMIKLKQPKVNIEQR